jgi:phage-related minor tail protein
MASTKYLSIVFTGEDKSATKTFRSVDDAAENTGSKLASLGSKISPAVAAASAAVVAGVGFAMKAAFDAATESAMVARETERVIQTTGASAWTTADQIGDLSTSISNLTGKDDELIQSSANLLLTFSNVKNQLGEGNDVFDQAVGLALDMSTALGTDASSASIQLGKALNDPIKGITALSRAGVSFTADQKEQIKTLVATGDTLGAQKIILAELGKEFGGAAQARLHPGQMREGCEVHC